MRLDLLKKIIKRKYKSVPGTLLWPGLLLILLVINYAFIPQVFGPDSNEFIVARGDSLRVVAANLKEKDLIKSKTFFVIYGLILEKDKELKAGHYELTSKTTHGILMEISGNGVTNDIRVTIPEGFNTWEIDERLASIGVTLPGEVFNFVSQEGWLFPDTYDFTKGDTPLTVVNKMNDNFSVKTAELRQQAAKEGRNWDDIVIMASMLEKEARSESDMKNVAGVLWKRLDAGMELKVDATVAYAVCLLEGEDCDVPQVPIRENLEIDSRYNTYKYTGLPPGPISNPGIKSLTAALNPRENSYWYYLSTKDGEIIYSQTGTEHEEKRNIHIFGN
jgi:UPF0755 protein